MRSTTDIVYGVTGQTLALRVLEGRPSSATFKVFNDFDSDDATPEFSGTATVDSVSTTVSGASGPSQADPQKILLTSTTGITIGSKYLLSESAKQEWVLPVEVTATYIRVRHPLRSDYTTSATFVSTGLTAAVDSTWVADLTNINSLIDSNPGYRVRWVIVVSGVTYVYYTFFDLVRASVGYQVDLSDLNDRAPGLVDSCPTEYQIDQGRPLLDAAWRSVQARLSAMRIDTDALRNDAITDELVILRALNMLACAGWRPVNFDSLSEYIAVTQAQYDRFLEQHFLIAQPHKMDTGTTGASDTVQRFVIGK